MLLSGDLVVWNNKITLDDKNVVGIETASLGELASRGIPIAHRIVITPHAFTQFLKDNTLEVQIKHLLGSLNHERHDSLAQVSVFIRDLIGKANFLEDIYEPLFELYSKLSDDSITLKAYYFRDGKEIGREKWDKIKGESTLAEHIRVAWSHLFSPGYLKRHGIHHKNHHTFSVSLVAIPHINFSITGVVKTYGSKKGEYEIEAHNISKFVYSNIHKKIEKGHYYSNDKKFHLNAHDIKKLLDYAHIAQKAFYLPQVMDWGKHKNEFLVTNVSNLTDELEFSDTYNTLLKTVTVHPGITVGRLRVINEKDRNGIVLNEEIVMLKSLDREMLNVISKVKGIILHDDPQPEIAAMLRNFGIPTVVKKDENLYSTGDVISLNATTGEIRRGNMLVS